MSSWQKLSILMGTGQSVRFKNAGFSSELQETDDLETAIASSDIIISLCPVRAIMKC